MMGLVGIDFFKAKKNELQRITTIKKSRGVIPRLGLFDLDSFKTSFLENRQHHQALLRCG